MPDSEKINSLRDKEHYSFSDLCEIMTVLRGEGGCPWDREQTHESIRNNFIEETYEVIEAIDKNDKTLLCEELGDVLMQVVFHSEIEREAGVFSIAEVTDGVCRKLVHRHPHIFADTVANDTKTVLANWDSIKKEEKKRETSADIMRSVPAMLPALMRAEKIGRRGAKAGFDFPDIGEAMKKVYEEADELSRAADTAEAEEELGDLLFSVVNVARLRGIDSERALNSATDKFIARFDKCEREAAENGVSFGEMSPSLLDKYWKNAKNAQK